MLIGFLAIIAGAIAYFSNEKKDNDEKYLGDDIEINIGSIVLAIVGLILIFCDLFNWWVYK